MKKLVLYGCGFPTIIKYISALNDRKPEWDIIGFIDDVKFGKQDTYLDHPILGDENVIRDYVDQGCYFFNNVSSNTRNMEIVANKLSSHNAKIATLILPEASQIDFDSVDIGEGSIISHGVMATAYAKIGRNVVIREGAKISHDNVIEDLCFIGPGVILLGGVEVGTKTYIGAGAQVMENVTIGRNSIIGMGSVVLKDVPDNTKMVGNPARRIPM